MGVHVPGLIAIIIFYLLILFVGIWAARKTGLKASNLKIQDIMLANRSIGLLVGCFTMTATWVGGGFINGTAEVVVFLGGLVWCQAPLGTSVGLLFNGIFFAEKLRSSGFTTMLDPMLWKYGDIMSCLLYLPALTGDVFYSGSILAALGATLKVILDISLEASIIVSAAIAVLYTIIGGLYSVAYTDVLQLICMFLGLWLCVPFAMTHEATNSITSENSTDVWLGTLEPEYIGMYIDFYLLLILGTVPVQVYWQRALSARTVKVAVTLSIVACVGCIIMAVPAVLIGAVAASTNWNETSYGYPEIQQDDSTLTLPLVMRHLCPTWVGFIGLGAVSAAVMSSTDSSILSASSLFVRNVFLVIYKRLSANSPSETVQVWVMRAAQVVIGGMACYMAIKVDSIYNLFVLCSDFVYVVLFPQLVCVMYLKRTNSYGSLCAYCIGLFFRLMGGESTLDIPTTIKFPWYSEADETQLFPFRTFAMLISLFTLIIVSYLTNFLFEFYILPPSADIYGCFPHLKSNDQPLEISSTVLDDGVSEKQTDGLRYRGPNNEKKSASDKSEDHRDESTITTYPEVSTRL